MSVTYHWDIKQGVGVQLGQTVQATIAPVCKFSTSKKFLY